MLSNNSESHISYLTELYNIQCKFRKTIIDVVHGDTMTLNHMRCYFTAGTNESEDITIFYWLHYQNTPQKL